jgi:hypothetical protein
MVTRDEIAEAFRANDARIDALRGRILDRPEHKLLEGEWRVRDALSHLAARANPVPRILERIDQGGDGAPPRINIDEINHGQVEERRNDSAADLIAELKAGHAAAVEALTDVDDELLALEIPLGFRPGTATVGEMLRMAGAGHEGTHLDQIEASLAAVDAGS